MAPPPMQYLQNEQGSPFSMTGHSAPGGLAPGSAESFGVEALARSVDAFSNHGLTGVGNTGHRSFGDFPQGMMLQGSSPAGPLHQFISDQSSPWNPVKAGVKLRQPSAGVNYNDPCFTEFRGTTGPSEYDDSGYYGSMVEPSVTEFSVCNDTESAFDTRSFVGNFSELQLQIPRGRGPEGASAAAKPPPRDAWNQQRSPNPDVALLVCPTCHSSVKTKAELNKHKSRHEKPYLCKIAGCTRKFGFGTTNDLDRHQRSVHGTSGIKYRCREGTCRTKPEKDWPRSDNFKQHLKRMHCIDLGSDPDLSKYEYKPSRIEEELAGSGQPEAKLDMLSSQSSWIGLDQSQSALPGPSDREISFGHHLEDHAMHLGHEMQQVPAPQETRNGQDHISLMETSETHQQSQVALEVKRPLPLEMDDNMLRGLGGHQTHAGGSTPIASHGLYASDGAGVSPAALSSLPGPQNMQEETDLALQSGPDQESDVANHQIQGTPRAQDTHPSERADTKRMAKSAALAFESQDVVGINDSIDEDSEDDAADEPHTSSESTSSRDDSVDDLKRSSLSPAVSDEPAPVALSSAKDIADSMDIDETSAFLKSLMEKGMLDKIISKFGYQKTKEEQEDKSPRERSPSPGPTNGKELCPDCDKTFKRPCELKKHRKRHEKPYACTHADCDKRFGSKNDWKRHENSQHIQLEFWRCNEKLKSDTTKPCAKICHRRQTFTDHLAQVHGVTDPKAQEERCGECRNGRNFESRFWCGFCQQTIEFKQNGGLALSERFDHIDAHFTGRNGAAKMDIKEWKSIESEPLETFHGILPDTRAAWETSGAAEEGTRKRARGREDDEAAAASLAKRRRFGKLDPLKDSHLWVCCDCNNYWSPAVTTRCLWEGCDHNYCGNCQAVMVHKTQDDA